MAFADSIVADIMIRASDHASATLARVGEEARVAGERSDTMGMGMAGAGKMALLMGAGVAAAAAAITAFSIHAGSQFEDTTLTIANNTAMSTKQMEQMRQGILKLGADSPASLDSIAKGFEKAANAGFTGHAAFVLVRSSMKAAVATGGDLATTVDAVTGVLKNFKLPASDAGHALGILMASAAAGDMRLPDLTQNFSKVATLAGAMHMPLQTTAAAFSTLTRFTHNASVAQTEFVGMLNHILNPTKATVTLMGQLQQKTGVDLVKAFHQASTGAISFNHLLSLVRKATHGNTAELSTLFGGIRGGQAAITLMNQGWKDLHTTEKSVANSTDLVAQAYARTKNSFTATMQTLWNKIQLVATEVGMTLLPALTHGAHALSDWLKNAMKAGGTLDTLGHKIAAIGKALFGWNNDVHNGTVEQQRFAAQLDSSRGIVTKHEGLIQQVGNAWNSATHNSKELQTSIKTLGNSFSTFGTGAHDLGVALGLIGTKGHDASAGMSLLRGACLAIENAIAGIINPLSGALVLLGGLMISIGAIITTVKNWAHELGQLGNRVTATVHTIQGFGTAILDLVKKVTRLPADLHKLWSDVEAVFRSAKSAIVGIVRDLANSIIDVFTHLADVIVGHSIVPDMVHAIIASISQLPARIPGIIGQMAAATIARFTAMAGSVLNVVGQMVSSVLSRIAAFAAQMAAAAVRAATGFITGLQSIVGRAVAVVGQMSAAVLGALGSLAGQVGAFGARVAQNFAAGIASGVGAVASAAGSLVQSALSHLEFHSPNKYGVDFEVYGANAGKSWAKGLVSSIPTIAAAAALAIGAATGIMGAPGQANAMAARSSNTSAMNPVTQTGSTAQYAALVAAINQLPPNLRSTMQPVLDGFQKQLTQTYDQYENKLRKENNDYLAKQKTIDDKYQQAVKSAMQAHAEALRHTMADHGIKISAQNAKYLAQTQGLYGKLDAALKAHNIKLATSLEQHIMQIEKAHGLADAAQRKTFNEYLKHQQALLDQHLKKLKQTYDQNIHNLDASHKKHVDALTAAFNKHVHAIEKALKAAATPAGMWNNLQTQVNNLADNTLKALSLALLTGTGNVQQLSAAAVSAALQQQQLSDAQAQAQALIQQGVDLQNAAQKSYISQTDAQRAQTAATNLLTQKIYDQQQGIQDSLPPLSELQDDVSRANAAVQAYTNAQQQAAAAAQTDVQKAQAFQSTLQQKQQDAQTLLTQKLYDLANGIQDSLPPLVQLQQDFSSASAAVTSYTQAQTDAGNTLLTQSQEFAAEQSAAQQKLSDAQQQAAYDIVNLGHMTADDATAIAAAQKAVDGFTNALALAQGGTNGMYAAQIKASQAAYDNAVAAYENGVAAGDSADQLANLKAAAINAGLALNKLQAIPQTITDAINAITKNNNTSPVAGVNPQAFQNQYGVPYTQAGLVYANNPSLYFADPNKVNSGQIPLNAGGNTETQGTLVGNGLFWEENRNGYGVYYDPFTKQLYQGPAYSPSTGAPSRSSLQSVGINQINNPNFGSTPPNSNQANTSPNPIPLGSGGTSGNAAVALQNAGTASNPVVVSLNPSQQQTQQSQLAAQQAQLSALQQQLADQKAAADLTISILQAQLAEAKQQTVQNTQALGMAQNRNELDSMVPNPVGPRILAAKGR